MFKKKCPRCSKKISKDHSFCPYCGTSTKDRGAEQRDYGLIGRQRDMPDLRDLGIKMPFGFNTIFNTLLKQVDKQFKELDKQIGKDIENPEMKKPQIKSNAISISISNATGEKPEIKISGHGPEFEIIKHQIKPEQKPVKIKTPEISEEKARKLSKLPKKEAETTVRRLSNKVMYEIKLPGVKNKEDIIIHKLENSIEIKAFSKDKAYFKLIPVSLPILQYKLQKETLILELQAKD